MIVLYKGNNEICKKSTITTFSESSSTSRYYHHKNKDEHFILYQEYADDISAIMSDRNKIDHIKKAVCKELEIGKLYVNRSILNQLKKKRILERIKTIR